MNRLILIGNGFDLAHGLKTKYNDFLLDYLTSFCISGIESIKCKNLKSFGVVHDDLLLELKIFPGSEDFHSLQSNSYYDEFISKRLYSLDSPQDILRIIKSELKVFPTCKGNGFVDSIIELIASKRWVDIESLYYDELKKNLREFSKYKLEQKKDPGARNRLENLNNQMLFLKKEFEKYLIKIQANNSPTIKEYHELFYLESFYKSQFEQPRETLVLNFNYTSTPNKYLKGTDKAINIHGELGDTNNPLIFGYGDDVDRAYSEIEDLNENEFLKHIKTFQYFKTNNYSNLLKFIRSNPYEVFIMGHSCGISDRTMLSTIFEHSNCSKLKIFYYNDDDLTDKSYEISRQFKDKILMRDKLFGQSALLMPQYNYAHESPPNDGRLA